MLGYKFVLSSCHPRRPGRKLLTGQDGAVVLERGWCCLAGACSWCLAGSHKSHIRLACTDCASCVALHACKWGVCASVALGAADTIWLVVRLMCTAG